MASMDYPPGTDAVPDTTLVDWAHWLPARKCDQEGRQSDMAYGQAKADALLGLNLRREVRLARREAKERHESVATMLSEKAVQARFSSWRALLNEYSEVYARARRRRTLLGMYCRYPQAVRWQVEVLATRMRDGLAKACASREAYSAAFVMHPAAEFVPAGQRNIGAISADWHLKPCVMDGEVFDHLPPGRAIRIAFIGTDDAEDAFTPAELWEAGLTVQYLASPDPEPLAPGAFESGPVSIRECRQAIMTALKREVAFEREPAVADFDGDWCGQGDRVEEAMTSALKVR